MCGICGILSLDESPVERGLIANMLAAIQHRGPDDSGLYVNGAVGLGHARLSVIDLSSGHQPMASEDRSIWITFNGEIFNYIELRKMLIRKGRRFRTNSDTEVLLQLYEEEGEDCVQRLNGQWAFAIWDSRLQKLFLSRDRLGVRPLFYCEAGGKFLFASAIKSLFVNSDTPRELDMEGVHQAFTFWHAVPPRTVFAGVSELPPGHSLTVQAGKIHIHQYWQLNFQQRQDAWFADERELAQQLGDLLIDAVRIRLRADVPVGAYLSGGLDSSVIAALVRYFTDAPLETFSVAFEDAEYDESSYQQQIVSRLQTTHHQVRCTHDDIGRAFPDAVWHAETALLRTAPVPMHLLAGLVRDRGFKVVLTGEGADEALGGYDIFKEVKVRSFWAARPESRLRPLLLRKLYPYMRQMQSQSPEYLRKFFRVDAEALKSPFFSHLPRWEMTSRLNLLFSDDVTAQWRAKKPWEDIEAQLPEAFIEWGHFERAQYLETAYLLPGYILSSQGDRPAMAHAIEGRFPFLDTRVVEFAAGLPSHMKMRGLNEKYLLKKFAADLLTAGVLRRPKQPYRAPDVRSFFNPVNGQLRHEYARELTSAKRIQQYGVFHAPAVKTLMERLSRQPQAATARDSMAITGVLSTQLLIHQFIEHKPEGTHGRGPRNTAAVYH